MALTKELTAENTARTARLIRIRRVSSFMKWFVTLFMLLLILTGLLLSAALLAPQSFDATGELIELGEMKRRLGEIGMLQRLGVCALVALAFLMLSAICWQIRQLFEFLRQGDFFSPGTLNRFVAIGGWLIAFGAIDILLDPLGSLLLSFDLPEGQRQLSVYFDGGELFFFVIGGLMIVCGWTLREAAQIAEENGQFI